MTKIKNDNFAKTKILCTLGPATSTTKAIKSLINNGMDGARLNFSHGSYDFYETVFNNITQACSETESPLAILIDLQGPKIRIGELTEPEIEIYSGDKIEITIDELVGTKELISTSYKPLIKDSKLNEIILIDDGLIKLKIIDKRKKSVVCLIQNGGTLRPKKGMNLPGNEVINSFSN